MNAISYQEPRHDWEDPPEETVALPGRPRRHYGGRATAALLALLLGVIGFYIGVRVEKSQLSSSSTSAVAGTGTGTGSAARASGAGGFARAFGGAGAGSGTGGATSGGGGGGGGAGGGFGAARAGGGTVGTLSTVDGDTLYLTDFSGNTIKVTLSPVTKITKSATVHSSALRPGDTVIVQGIKGAGGGVTAASVSDSGARTGGFGGASGGSGSGGSSPSSGGSAVSSLFGSGGGG